ncbi:MAG: repeat containing protein [Moraxellaceae bacterium]|nr:repeat containing protein [Moraxellaceae bacterium]
MFRRYSAQSRFIAFLMTFSLAVFLSGCGGGGGGGAAAGGAPVAGPAITAVTPATGSPAGGNDVTIYGTDFTGATQVTFGGVPATAFTVDSATRITATVPAGTVGRADIVVTTPTRTLTATDAYLYYAVVSAVAGTTSGFSGDGAAATAAQLSSPTRAAVDSVGNLYLTDSANDRIRVVARVDGTNFGVAMTAGNIYTVAGGGGAFGEGGAATAAALDTPAAVAFDSDGNLFIADTGNHVIRMVPKADGTYYGIAMTANNIYTVAGTGTAEFSGDGGVATAAELDQPFGLAFDSVGNLYFPDRNNERVRVLVKTPGTYFGISMPTANAIYTVMGDGTAGVSANGTAAATARLNSPTSVAFDSAGNLYVTSLGNHLIQLVAKTDGTYFGVPATAGNAYIVAGDVVYGSSGDGGPATSARFLAPTDLAFDSAGNLYISDYGTGRVRTIAKTSGEYFGVTMTANSIYSVAGTVGGDAGDDGAATAAKFRGITGIAFNSDGVLYLVDQYVSRVRQVTP